MDTGRVVLLCLAALVIAAYGFSGESHWERSPTDPDAGALGDEEQAALLAANRLVFPSDGLDYSKDTGWHDGYPFDELPDQADQTHATLDSRELQARPGADGERDA